MDELITEVTVLSVDTIWERLVSKYTPDMLQAYQRYVLFLGYYHGGDSPETALDKALQAVALPNITFTGKA